MPLTYQPFENVPEINALGKELHTNVSELERVLSACAGAYLILQSFGRSQLIKWPLLASGSALIRRAWTGHCPLYEEMEVKQRQKQRDSQHPLPVGPQVPPT